MKYEEKTNDELTNLLREMHTDWSNLKSKILKDYDLLMEIEEEFQKAASIMKKRVNGNINGWF